MPETLDTSHFTAIGLCGRMGAGKTTLAAQLSQDSNQVEIISFGDFVRSQVASQGLEPSRGNLQNLGQETYEEHGPANFIDLVLQWKNPQKEIHLFEGVRHLEVWNAIVRRYENAHLIYLELDAQHQRERLQKRGDTETLSNSGFANHIVESEYDLLREQASLIVNSPTSTDMAIAQIKHFFADIMT